MASVDAASAPTGFTTQTQSKPESYAPDAEPDLATIHSVQEKYLAEKEKRMNPSGTKQYRTAIGDESFHHFLDDPYAPPNFKREPVEQDHEIVILGGGYGGLLLAARLLEAGFADILIIEKASDFGGVWYWNRYPGAQCDIESYIYMPLLEELNYTPLEKYSKGEELFAYAQSVGKHYDLYRRTLFQTFCTSISWDDKDGVWRFETNPADKISGRFVIPCGGPFNMPKFPGIAGIDNFKGTQFHSSRWDYDYTGGDRAGNLEKLKDKRVGVIGTGASAVQIVPHLGASAGELYVFQRTPSTIDIRGNGPTDQAWVQTLKKGWQKERMDNFNTVLSGGKVNEDLVADGWTEILRLFAQFFGPGTQSNEKPPDEAEVHAAMGKADYAKMESLRSRVDKTVTDPEKANALKPWFSYYCKRPCFHDEYLNTFNRSSVHIVDTDGKGVEAVTEKGIVAAGKEIELDCLIYATGFDWSDDYVARTGTSIYGRGGISITDKWKDGMRTFHGWSIHDFPNLFMITTGGGGITPNYMHNIATLSEHFVYVLKTAKKLGLKRIECTSKAEDAWIAEVVGLSTARHHPYLKQCTPGYYNDEGMVTEKTSQRGPYAGGALAYIAILEEWRKSDKLEGLVH